MPTTRYAHAILGDAIEAGGLAVRLRSGETVQHILPKSQVFEDITPRLADLDGDGKTEVVTIRASQTGGAALALYGVRDGAVKLLDATPDIGRANRWLNPAAIHDFDGDGHREIAFVRTPHIGGVLEVWTYTGGRLAKRLELAGVSNHAIGARAQDLSAVMDIDGDGRGDLILPDQRHRELVAISITPWTAQIVGRARLPGTISGNIVVKADVLTVPVDGTSRARIRADDFQ